MTSTRRCGLSTRRRCRSHPIAGGAGTGAGAAGAAGDGQCEVEEGLHDGVAGRRKGRTRPKRGQLMGVCDCWVQRCGMRQLTCARTDSRVMVGCGGQRAARSASA